ncbi:heme ABC exporter ATP-binding protein CcmA [Anaplasma capra]|uniref:heme ABC exporter ATP-binding protein CcmA n=1 Tax=Anaplasma capra TaxID=1562740 RepID=UPI0021D583C6|nr:heme ABC exporter ATP-binding protein CcmA [Anaplasma capra]MCU7611733.1 heme ABC exporter ATP-binding protein CcmA [Anaplasma capra]MCU7612516.1 heme ABC exporter ATP-binding protein CcmA [Anaplasma capra]
MLECLEVSCIRGSKLLFQNLSFTAENGSVTLVVGNNGSGKTTLLRTIVGLMPAASGSIKLDGENITTGSQCITQITYIGHKSACTANMKVQDILEFWAKCKGNSELTGAASHFFGLYPVLDTKFKNLSSGWQKIVSLSRLLVSNTRVWIVDEPFANLDPDTVTMVQSLMLTRAERGGIVILTDHKVDVAFANAQIVRLGAVQ